jgi:hypothetical protein
LTLAPGDILDVALEFDYARSDQKPDCRWRENAERERMLTRVAQDAERCLLAVERANGLLRDEAVDEAHDLLRELIGQDFDVDADGIPRLDHGTRQRRIVSVHDPRAAPRAQFVRAVLRLLQAARRRRLVKSGVGLRSRQSLVRSASRSAPRSA